MKVKYVFSIFIILGTCFIGVGIYFYVSTSALIDAGTVVDGVVVRMEKERSGQGPDLHRAVVEYVDHVGGIRELRSSTATYPPSYFEGEKVKVIYNPNDPKYPLTAEIKDFWNLYGGSVFMVCFGAFFVLVALLCLYLLSKGGEVRFDHSPEEGYEEI